ncbi:MAG: hypothetical protein JW953_16660 [Anaerolineae bacterium]|nr:hypothetical protein [Anaerolineae bacterium]
MTRSQALTIGVLAGFVVLVFMAMLVLVFFPFERMFPSPTPVLLPPSPPPTPTFANFLPTAGLLTPTPAEPTPTNTRVPTATPRPLRPATPTIILKLPTLPPKPTATPVPVTIIPIPTATPTTTISPTPAPRQYSISFKAEDSTVEKGDCTKLKWQVTGAAAVTLNEESVTPSGEKKVCPKKDEKYRLAIRLPDGTSLHRTVKISVEEEREEKK